MIYPQTKILDNQEYKVEWSTDLINWSNSGLSIQLLAQRDDYDLIRASISIEGINSVYMRINRNVVKK